MSAKSLKPEENRISPALVKTVWILIVAVLLILYLIALPHMYVQEGQICNGANCPNDQLTSADMRQLQQAGLSLHFYAVYDTVLDLVYTLVFCLVAAVIFWRRPNDRMAIYASLALISFAVAVFISPLDNLKADVPALRLPVQLTQCVSAVGIVVFYYIFPNGRFAPRWLRWAVPLVVAREALNVFAPQLPGVDLMLIVELGSVIFAQIYRYNRVSTPLQRQQTKWAVFGVVAAMGLMVLFMYGGELLFGRLAGIGFIVFPTAMYSVVLLLPLSLAMAILRSHLWDIDILIRRTLIYATLTVILALIYAGSVILLQQILLLLTGQREAPVIIVLSTLAIAALFTPARRRVQRWMDKRFYRQRYDAEKVLSSFRSLAQSEVDLNQLTGGLIEIVETTVHPDSLALWLRRKS